MDHDNLWKVAIVPSQAASSNDTIVLSTRTLSTISEQESKRDLLFNENKEENGCRNAGKSNITYQKLNHNISHLSQSNKQSICENYALCENKKNMHNRINKKINKENTCSQTYPDINSPSNAPFIELGAAYKILDFITGSDPKVSSLTNNCNEISRILRCLLAQSNDKKLEDLLLNDSSLYRCERCGVISYILGLRPATEELKGNRTKARTRDAEITTAECDSINKDQNKDKISINLPDLKNNAQSRIFVDDSKVNCRAKSKEESNGIESLPVKKSAFAMRNCIGNPNGVNNISDTEADVKIKHKSHFNNNTIKKLFTNFETIKRDKKYNRMMRNNNSRCESSTTMKAYADVGKEKIVRKISYEHKSQIDDVLARDMHSKIAQKIHGSQRLLEEHGDIYPVIDTVKYLARGQFTMLDKQKDELLSKLREERCTRMEDARKEQSNILYNSRDDYPQRNSGFWLFDKTGHLPEIVLDEYHYLPMPRMNGNRENTNSLRYFNKRERTKNRDNCNYIEKDSLEDCTLLEETSESDTMTFSSSSTENLIHEWIESLDRKYEKNDIDGDISRGRRLVSSRASLDIARHVRAQIADDKRSDNAEKSMYDLHDSDIFSRLSPKIRKEICHLMKKIVSSGSARDSAFYHEKCLMTGMLNNKKLQHPKSVDASFVHSNEITNNCANDCVSIKLSELLEDKNCLSNNKRQNNFVNTRCSQDLRNSKEFVKISSENMTIPVSSDKFEKANLSDNFTRKVTQHIIYKNASLKDISNDKEHTVEDISTIYRKILENSKNMDWDSFQKLVEILHPAQKELWRDICKIISEEAKKIAGDADDNTEVCIEISPSVNPGNTFKTGEVTECVREIVFELDMTLKDVETFFSKNLHLAEKHLDTHKDADESTTMDWSNERKAISKQTR